MVLFEPCSIPRLLARPLHMRRCTDNTQKMIRPAHLFDDYPFILAYKLEVAHHGACLLAGVLTEIARVRRNALALSLQFQVIGDAVGIRVLRVEGGVGLLLLMLLGTGGLREVGRLVVQIRRGEVRHRQALAPSMRRTVVNELLLMLVLSEDPNMLDSVDMAGILS